jgi:hypothetical protein
MMPLTASAVIPFWRVTSGPLVAVLIGEDAELGAVAGEVVVSAQPASIAIRTAGSRAKARRLTRKALILGA